MEAALEADGFVSDRACFSFVGDLEEVEGEIAALVETDPARAVGLYEAFLAGCYQKAEELDDSSGSFGAFVAELFCGWVRARQAADAGARETAARLVAWMDDDPYGFCFGLERDLAGALDKAGSAALVDAVRGRLDALGSPAGRPPGAEGARRRWVAVLRALLLARRDVGGYVELAEATGVTAQDCHAVATMLASRRRREEALAWVDRGRAMPAATGRDSLAGHDLEELRRRLLRGLGREEEARESAWAEYREHPSIHAYRRLMRFAPKADRAAWHARAIEDAIGTDLHSLIGLLVETKETERLARVLDSRDDRALERLSHFALEPAARRLERAHARIAARLWQAMAMRILNEGKSKHYQAALRNLDRAKRCYTKAGREGDWERVVDEIRARHQRKYAFMPSFERLVGGNGPDAKPPFLERAKARWIT